MPIAVPASTIDNPAKYRSSTSRAAAGSIAANLARASSIMRSWLGAAVLMMSMASMSSFCSSPPLLFAPLGPGSLHQDATHGFSRGGEEVTSAVPAIRPLDVHESKVSFMHECGGLEGMTGRLGSHSGSRQFPQLVIDEREQVDGGLAVARRGRVEETGHVGHYGRV